MNDFFGVSVCLSTIITVAPETNLFSGSTRCCSDIIYPQCFSSLYSITETSMSNAIIGNTVQGIFNSLVYPCFNELKVRCLIVIMHLVTDYLWLHVRTIKASCALENYTSDFFLGQPCYLKHNVITLQ